MKEIRILAGVLLVISVVLHVVKYVQDTGVPGSIGLLKKPKPV